MVQVAQKNRPLCIIPLPSTPRSPVLIRAPKVCDFSDYNLAYLEARVLLLRSETLGRPCEDAILRLILATVFSLLSFQYPFWDACSGNELYHGCF
jgi:hypothetical protein